MSNMQGTHERKYKNNRLFSFLLASLAVMLVMLSFSFSVKAKEGRIDSLQSVLNRSLADTIRVTTLLELGNEFFKHGDYDKVISTANRVIEIVMRINYGKGEGHSYILMGLAHQRRADYQQAQAYFEKATVIFERLGMLSELASAHLYAGQTHDYQAGYNLALKEYDIALSLCHQVGNTEVLIRILNSVGVTHSNLGNYQRALKSYLEAASISAHHGINRHYAGLLNNIGVIYQQLEQYQEAEKYFKLFLEASSRLGDQYFITVALVNLGEVRMLTGNRPSAIDYFQRALAIQRELRDHRGQSITLVNLGNVYGAMDSITRSEHYYREALQFAESTGNKDMILKPLKGLAQLLIKGREFEQAESYTLRMMSLARSTGSKPSLEQVYLLQSQLDSARGNFTEAYQWHKKFTHLKDSLLNEKTRSQLVQMQELYENEKKDKEILRLNEAKKREELKLASEKSLLGLVLFFSIVSIAVLVFWLIVKARLSARLKMEKNRVAQANRELSELIQEIENQKLALAQKNETLVELHAEKDGLIGIVAHDLRSPLNRIKGLSSLVKMSGPLNADQQQFIDKMEEACAGGTSLIRDLLDINQYESIQHTNTASVELHDFFRELVSHYKSQLVAKNISLHLELEPGQALWLSTDRDYLSRIVDNLLTNAIKFSPCNRNIYLMASRSPGNDTVVVKLKDEGPGFTSEDLPQLFKKFKKLSARPTGGESSTGLGLSIVKTLLEKIGGSIDVESRAGAGATFIISLPIKVPEPEEVC